MKRDDESLGKYNSMRDFGVTAEPAGTVHPSRSGFSYVVQKHDATRLHYDFRLELGGVLKSWAVPKGPSLSTKDKRLAVQTEDHPVDYRDFEGTIPEGEYGGGPVIVWDRGTWEPIGDPHAGLARGRLEFVVHGEKLHGKYLLVRLADRDAKKSNWLLLKRGDEHAREGKAAAIVDRMPRSVLSDRTIADVVAGVPGTRPKQRAAKASHARSARRPAKRAALPAFGKTSPELATLVDDVPTKGPWLYELKYDGYRILATLDDGEVRLASRNGKDWTDHFPEIADALSRVRAKTALFDGEVAYVLEDGRTDFQHLQNALSGGDRSRLVYFVFDLLHYDGADLTSEPLRARKDTLRTLLAGERPPLKLGDHLEGDGEALFARACKMGLEGIVAKRADAPYRAGRGKDWVKIKCQKRQEMVIVGFTPPKGSRSGLGALLLGVREGDRFRYAGKVGTGFTRASLEDLASRLRTRVVERPPVADAPRMRDATWVKPELVCEVRFTEWTAGGSLRHPTFDGLREDKKPAEVVREKPQKPPRAAEAAPLAIGRVAISHPERVVDAGSGATKADLARYTEVVADRLLAFAKKRPLMLMRCPEGHASRATCFFQKHSGRGLVHRLPTSRVDGEEVLYVTKRDELFELVQFNAVELHGWGCRLPKFDRPDWIVFDLDPDEGLAFAKVVDAARGLREELRRLGLVSFVKTTGGKGLHVVVPLAPKHDWAIVSAFSAAVADGMVKRDPSSFVATMSKAARKGRIFVDHFRNARGATAVLPYSPRAREGLPVALPVSWRDLGSIDPRELTILTVPKLLARQRIDPWAELLDTKQTLSKRIRDAL